MTYCYQQENKKADFKTVLKKIMLELECLKTSEDNSCHQLHFKNVDQQNILNNNLNQINTNQKFDYKKLQFFEEAETISSIQTETTNKNLNKSQKRTYAIIIDQSVLDEIIFRFFLNLTDIDLHPVRLGFIIEEAHWFLIDFYVQYQNMSFRAFAIQLFTYIYENNQNQQNEVNKDSSFCMNQENSDRISDIFTNAAKIDRANLSAENLRINAKMYLQSIDFYLKIFNDYKFCVPVYGAIIFDSTLDYVLLNQGYSKKAQFVFPRGKKSFNETGKDTAIREVYEEVGLDVKNKILDIMFKPKKEKYSILIVVNQRMNVHLKSHTRNEIRDIKWVKMDKIFSDTSEFSQIRKMIIEIKTVLDFLKKNQFHFNKKRILDIFDEKTKHI